MEKTSEKRVRRGGRKAPGPRRRGGLGRIFGFFSGLGMLVLTTSIFFGLLVLASYYAFAYFIRGEEIATPDMTGRPVIEALAIAKERNLSLELTREEPSEILAAGEILSQSPRPGARIKSRTPVKIVVSSGRRRIMLPESLTGISRLQAGIDLRELGLDVGEVAFVPTVGKGDDVILSLDPPVGTLVPPGTPVSLLVATDAAGRAFVMPDLSGMSPEQANEELARFGLAIESVSEQSASGARGGTIHRQRPPAGTPLNARTEVEVVVMPLL